MHYVGRRLLLTIPTFWAAITLVFVLVRVVPGDPATAALGDYASKDAVEALRIRMGLDEPLWVQYLRFLGGLLKGDFGRSLITSQPLGDQIFFVLPYSLQLCAAAFVLGLGFGVPLGVLTAVRRNTSIDYLVRLVSLFGLSVPAFYLGILLVLLLAIRFPLLPAVGGGDLARPADALRHLILPALTLGMIMTAYVTRMTRSVMLTVLGEDFIRTATSKGLSRTSVLFRHGLRAGAVPLVSLVGLFAITLIGGSVLTEIVFSRPGLGKLMVGAMLQRDYIALQSIMAVYSAIIVAVNLLTDILYGLVDPRTRATA